MYCLFSVRLEGLAILAFKICSVLSLTELRALYHLCVFALLWAVLIVQMLCTLYCHNNDFLFSLCVVPKWIKENLPTFLQGQRSGAVQKLWLQLSHHVCFVCLLFCWM